MAKLPKWMYSSPTLVNHPASTLRDVAKVLGESSKISRKQGLKDFAMAESFIAGALLKVADGATWAQAFDLPAIPASNKEQA